MVLRVEGAENWRRKMNSMSKEIGKVKVRWQHAPLDPAKEIGLNPEGGKQSLKDFRQESEFF